MLAGFSQAIAQKGLPSPWDSAIYTYAGDDQTLVWLTKAIISRESAWDPDATRTEPQIQDMSVGLMQILQGTAAFYESVSLVELLDPETNIRIGMAHLKSLLRQYGTLGEAISAYNAGRPITGNKPYVDDVLTYYIFYANNEPGTSVGLPDEEGQIVTMTGDVPSTATPTSGLGAALDTVPLLLLGVALVVLLRGQK